MKQINVDKGRTVVIPVSLGYDVSGDTITSQIRTGRNQESDLIATWSVSFATDGTDGELVLTLDNSVTSLIEKTSGYMDIKRVSAGEPVSVIDEPLEVIFKDTITV
jgi:hypothetical protein